MANGHDPNSKDEMSGGSPLHSAVINGHLEMVTLLLEHGADANFRASRNVTPLHSAADEGHVAIAETLLAHGAKVNVANELGKQTPLHLAARNGSVPLVTLVIKNGADTKAKTDGGGTPLDMAANADMAQMLQSHSEAEKRWWQFWK